MLRAKITGFQRVNWKTQTSKASSRPSTCWSWVLIDDPTQEYISNERAISKYFPNRGGKSQDICHQHLKGEIKAQSPAHRHRMQIPEGKTSAFRARAPGPDGHWIDVNRSIDRKKWEKLKDAYYKERGWNLTTGIPNRAKLEELDLGDIANDLDKLGLLEN